jgi:hypothetical protein
MRKLRPLLLLILLVSCRKPDARIAEARKELGSFSNSVHDFRDQKGRWPTNLVEAVGERCLGERHDCVSSRGKRLDPWGSVYEYDTSLKSALLRSPGPDQRLGTRDDLEASVPAEGPLKP